MNLQTSSRIESDPNTEVRTDISSTEVEITPLRKNSLLSNRLNTFFTFLMAIMFSFYMLFTVFEVNRQSLDINSDHIRPNITAPAKRVVIFLSDGQRADATFTIMKNKLAMSPHLRNIAQKEGTYGISLATLPTESKICITSLLSGNYLDLPDLYNIYFNHRTRKDIVLNNVNHGWAFGIHEIVQLYQDFEEKDHKFKIIRQDYKYTVRKMCSQNDRIFSLLAKLLKDSETDKELNKKLRSEKVIFFIHLVCVDDMGHKFRSLSKIYAESVSATDSQVHAATLLLKKFFNDDKTAFLFTSDHGMQDSGVHGDDNPKNKNTPFVAWGAGINKPKFENIQVTHTMNWDLPNLRRVDLRQVDVAALVSSLLGTDFPINSEGIVPLEYLEDDPRFRAESIFANSKQICSALPGKERGWADERLRNLREMVDGENFFEAQKGSLALIEDCLNKSREYRVKEKEITLILFAFSSLSWILYLCIQIKKRNLSEIEYMPLESIKFSGDKFSFKVWVGFCLALLFYCWILNSGIRIYGYCCILFYLTFKILQNLSALKSYKLKSYLNLIWIFFLIVSIFLMGFQYEHNEKNLKYIFLLWSFSNLIENRSKWVPILTFIVSSSLIYYILRFQQIDAIDSQIFKLSWMALGGGIFMLSIYYRRKGWLFFLITSLFTLYSGSIASKFEATKGYEREDNANLLYNIAKLSLPFAILGPFLFKLIYKPNFNMFFISIVTSLSPLIVFQSLSHEPLFMLGLSMFLLSWKFLEKLKDRANPIKYERNTIFAIMGFCILNQVCFFGAGNIAALDSFRLESVFRIFEEFEVARFALMLYVKFCTPFFILSLFMQGMMKELYPKVHHLFVNILFNSICSLMVFCYLSTNQKVDLDMKKNISYPVIISLISITYNLLSGLAYLAIRSVNY